MMFSLEFLQAVNDWQRGGDHKQKVRRGARLKELAVDLPEQFRRCDQYCYRQEAHEKDRIWQLLAEECLPETIAAWTVDLEIAKSLKGGVPPDGLLGAIFRLAPPAGSVIVNLVTLYNDKEFLAVIEKHKPKIDDFDKGIGRWFDTQKEVILALQHLEPSSVFSLGGFSSNREELVQLYKGRPPTQEDLEEFDRLAEQADVSRGAWWLNEDGTQNVLSRVRPHLPRLREKKKRDQSG